MATRQSGKRVDYHDVSKPIGLFSGAQDIVVVKQEDGKIRSTPWTLHIKWRSQLEEEISVKIRINDKTVDDIEISRKNWKKVSARIYRLPPRSKLIVTDIDKTLTKSVILGFSSLFKSHPKLHKGTAKLFSELEENRFIIIYLTARPITWWRATHRLISDHFLVNGAKKLPDGPLFCSNAGLIETIIKGHFRHHDDVKIPILQELQAVFCEGSLFAGFGDADTDRRSYFKVGIPYKRIYKIDKNGHVRFYDGNGKVKKGYVDQDTLAEFLKNFCKVDQPHSEERPSSPRPKNCQCSVPISSPSCNDMNEEEQPLLNQEKPLRKKKGLKSWLKKIQPCCFKKQHLGLR